MALDGGVPGQDGAAGTAAARASRGSASRSRWRTGAPGRAPASGEGVGSGRPSERRDLQVASEKGGKLLKIPQQPAICWWCVRVW